MDKLNGHYSHASLLAVDQNQCFQGENAYIILKEILDNVK